MGPYSAVDARRGVIYVWETLGLRISRDHVTLSQRESTRFLDNAIAAINGLFAERASTEPVSISPEGSAKRIPIRRQRVRSKLRTATNFQRRICPREIYRPFVVRTRNDPPLGFLLRCSLADRASRQGPVVAWSLGGKHLSRELNVPVCSGRAAGRRLSAACVGNGS